VGRAGTFSSACDTQRGRLQRDEGVVALPWGLHFAGCPTVVATLWEVSDASTPILMEGFCRRLTAEEGQGRLAALQAAKRALRETHPHPFHWAPLLLLGDPR
jgi:CHAT domain-containing protein